jgi:transposase
MMMLPSGVKVFIATKPVDMRKSHDGLAALIQTVFQKDTFSGHLFVFFSKQKDRVKIFYWDRNGYCYWYKRLEKGLFPLPRVSGDLYTLSPQELCLLLEGIDLTYPKRLRAL